jgi:threonine synthase
MDISKASNFERFVYDLVGRDGAVREWWARCRNSASFPDRSTHANRIATIRRIWNDYGVMVDPHTADGLKVGLEQRAPACR